MSARTVKKATCHASMPDKYCRFRLDARAIMIGESVLSFAASTDLRSEPIGTE
jgi:hypothetical protein